MNPHFSTTSVEASTPKVDGSLLHVEGSAAPVSLAYQEQIVAQEHVKIQEISTGSDRA